MTYASEAKLIEALKEVERGGDVARPRSHDPSTMILRHLAVRDDLIRWDPDTGSYYLTTSGFARLDAQNGRSAKIMRLPVGAAQTRRVS